MGLKIVHLNTYQGNGGAGRACLRLNEALNAQGFHSRVLVYLHFSASEQTLSFSDNLFKKTRAIFHILAERYLVRWFVKAVKTPYSLQWFGTSVLKHPAVSTADIIHVHWINHGFLNPKFLAQLGSLNKPIVWTFHDSNAFTGGCHVRYDCENYRQQCGNCPILKNSHANDLSRKNWLNKQRAYSSLKFHIIAPSSWMANSVKKSGLLHLSNTSVIPNTIDTTVFTPIAKQQAKKLLNIAEDNFVMMSGFMPSKNDKHKGTQYLMEALNRLKDDITIDPKNIELVIFGNKGNDEIMSFPFKTIFLGNIDNDPQLANAYSAADVFITPSLEDNLPNTVMESLACATPVVAFETGGIPDMVKHLHNGYLAEYKSAGEIAKGVAWFYHHPHREEIQQNARASILAKFAPHIVAKQHIELYKRLINRQ